jgi:hypothetical protein
MSSRLTLRRRLDGLDRSELIGHIGASLCTQYFLNRYSCPMCPIPGKLHQQPASAVTVLRAARGWMRLRFRGRRKIDGTSAADDRRSRRTRPVELAACSQISRTIVPACRPA